ncbi:ATP-binding cassette domain-containing protein [Flavobacterium zepuense]|uniref:ATP-binding cassette domain-containing protein n=1 Tax=Flavobacterium zepuense TaxID=2593302 RepID=A0A552VAA0_9FLAO|nr:ATP-binding cassette domain-containing protein [Flavobacterium zepuense]TRW27407.1 ATP-binding cassette domain-containing protein [Flavobacterium zepuense]
MKEILLQFSNVTIKNNATVVFSNLNFTLKKGEYWAIVGKSGSGKTTLLEALAGKKHISGVTVAYTYFDSIIQGSAEHNSRNNLIALVSSTQQFKNRSNTTDLYYQQRFNSSDSEDAQTVREYLLSDTTASHGYWTIEKIIARLNLSTLADKEIIKLSNGETRRLMLAKALVKNPVLLLLDAPLVGLDTTNRADFNLLLKEITASGITVVITVSTNKIPNTITHIAVLDDCKIVSQQPIEKFRTNDISVSGGMDINVEFLKQLLSKNPMPQYNTIIKMQDVAIKYGDKTILDTINWEVKQGERWALSGHNGAGKSTLLSLVNGDNPQAYANNIVLFDKQRGSGESIWDIKKKIGFVSPELFQYFPARSGCLEVIESGLYDTIGLFRTPSPKNRKLILQWMQLLGIEEYSNKLFSNASASIQRLCLLARALIKNPPLLIFDEPCQGMDAEQRDHFKFLTDTICKNSNVTLIYVSHYPEDIPQSVTHFLKLENGRMVN